DHRDLIFDPGRNLLYITTSSGLVQRYNATFHFLQPAWQVGTALNGGDITPDGRFLYVTEQAFGNGQGTVHKVDLASGAVTDLHYPLVSFEGGSFSVAVGPNAKALFTGGPPLGSSWVPVRQIDLATDSVTTRPDPAPRGVFSATHLVRAGDRSLLFGTQSDT